jgi:hypothetical protein
MEVLRCAVDRETRAVKLRIAATQRGAAVPRLTTWPVPVKVDGTIARWIRIGLQTGVTSHATVTLPSLTPGAHRVVVGNSQAQTINVP